MKGAKLFSLRPFAPLLLCVEKFNYILDIHFCFRRESIAFVSSYLSLLGYIPQR